ncbi:hypothetical protein HDU77_006752 [Chytriomyces hyalinus]|nr:hypothetical protein HDU77_006752 [Chytriomyces hyalinus]
MSTLLDAQERLAKLELVEDTNATTDIQLTQSQPSHAAVNPLSGVILLVLRMKPQPQAPQAPQPTQAQDENIIQKIIEHGSSSNLDKSHVGSNGDTLSDFGSDNDDDAVWDQAWDDTESVQEKQQSNDKEQVDYLAMMENSESLANRGKAPPHPDPPPHGMPYHTQRDSGIAMLNDAQEGLARLHVAHGREGMNTAACVQPMPRQPVHAAANPLVGNLHLIIRLKSQPQPPPQPQNNVQNIDETDSATDSDDQSQASTDDDTLSDFGSDSDNDAVWDCALDDAESVQEQPSDEKEELVDYLAMMEAEEANMATNATAPEGRENTRWEARWNIAEEVMLGEIAIYEMDRYDPDEEIYPWEFE